MKWLQWLVIWLIGLGIIGAWTWWGFDNAVQNHLHGGSLLLAVAVMVGPLMFLGWLVAYVVAWLIPSWRRNRSDPTIDNRITTVAVIVMFGAGGLLYFQVQAIPTLSGELATAIAPACAGEAVRGAGAAAPTGGNHLVVLDMEGREFGWTSSTPDAWRPPASAVADTEFVACITHDEQKSSVETCQYEGGPPITRYAAWRDVKVVAAATGEIVAQYTVSATPDECPRVASKQTTEITATLSWEAVRDRLESIVKTGG